MNEISQRVTSHPRTAGKIPGAAIAILESIPTGILLLDMQGRISYANKRAAKILRTGASALNGKFIHQIGWQLWGNTGMQPSAFVHALITQGPDTTTHFIIKARQSPRLVIEINAAPYISTSGELEGIIASFVDITQRDEIMQKAHKNEELLHFVVTNAPIVLWSINKDGIFTLSDGIILKKLGLSPGAMVGVSIFELYKDNPEIIESARRALSGEFVSTQSNLNGTVFDVRYNPIIDENGQVSGVIGVSLDITDQALAEQQIEQQFRRISALHKIDNAIINSSDIAATMKILLQEVIEQLNVDAADILLYDPASQTLRLAASSGFQFSPPPGADSPEAAVVSYRMGEAYAGICALFRQKIYVPDLPAKSAEWYSHNPGWDAEGFASYIGLPLVAKNVVRGVLEVFTHQPNYPDADWLHFFNILAGQVAIAMDNAILFAELQQSNQNLSLAYDSTLAGWARALELRDKETEGHSQRVLKLTLELANQMDLSLDELVHIRRGALLHDIGKMGVSDNILQKAGPLTEKEWKVMRLHPVHAYNLLSPISYLERAIEIPYCHHEHWDGSGYPRGLKGTEIPLAARIFSVIDAWDALQYDRPYRKAWPEEQIITYLREQAGILFDPTVVDTFLEMVKRGTGRLKKTT